eukprot:7717846-Pyramimonas_sp.AAC.1
MNVLGSVVDANLTFQPLLDRTCAMIVSQTQEIVTSFADLGLGLPLLTAQFGKRILPAVLYGCELLACFTGGWAVVSRRLNEAMYSAAKCMLGLRPSVSLGAGGH